MKDWTYNPHDEKRIQTIRDMKRIDFTFTSSLGTRLGTIQTECEESGYEKAAKRAQELANEYQTAVAFTAWLEDREGATGYRYPKKRGRPPTGNAKTTAERQAAFRRKKRADGICPCCGQPITTN